jgi:hypothetical protein
MHNQPQSEERARRADRLRFLRQAWDESEWVLNFLRSTTGTPLKPATDEEVEKWAAKPT